MKKNLVIFSHNSSTTVNEEDDNTFTEIRAEYDDKTEYNDKSEYIDCSDYHDNAVAKRKRGRPLKNKPKQSEVFNMDIEDDINDHLKDLYLKPLKKNCLMCNKDNELYKKSRKCISCYKIYSKKQYNTKKMSLMGLKTSLNQERKKNLILLEQIHTLRME